MKKSILSIALLSMLFITGACSVKPDKTPEEINTEFLNSVKEKDAYQSEVQIGTFGTDGNTFVVDVDFSSLGVSGTLTFESATSPTVAVYTDTSAKEMTFTLTSDGGTITVDTTETIFTYEKVYEDPNTVTFLNSVKGKDTYAWEKEIGSFSTGGTGFTLLPEYQTILGVTEELTFKSVSSGTEAVYTDDSDPAKEVTITLTTDGGTMVSDKKEIDFTYEQDNEGPPPIIDPTTPEGKVKLEQWVKTINNANLYDSYSGKEKFTLDTDGSYDDGDTKQTVHGFVSDTKVIYAYEMPLDEAGTVKATVYHGYSFENNSLKQAGFKVEYDFNGDEDNLEEGKAFYEKQYAIANINWDKTDDTVAQALATDAQKKEFAKALNAENLKAENAKDTDISEMLDFTVTDAGTFTIKGTKWDDSTSSSVLKDISYGMVFYTSPTEAEFTNSGQSDYINLETLAFVDGKFGKMENSGANDIMEMKEIIAVKDSSAESKTTWIKSVKDGKLKFWERDNMGSGALKDFTIDTTTGEFKIGSAPNLTTYTFLRADSATTAIYTDNKSRSTMFVTLEEGLFKVRDNYGSSSIIATTVSTPAEITAYAKIVNAKNLVYGKNSWDQGAGQQVTTPTPFTFSDAGVLDDYKIIRVLANDTILMVNGSRKDIYGFVGDKFGSISSYGDKVSLNQVLAIMPLNTIVASHQAAFKTAIAGSYKVRIDNVEKPFTIAADGSFTLDSVKYTLHNTRSATEGIFKTADNKYIGISVDADEHSTSLKLYAKLDSRGYGSLEGADTFDKVDWFSSNFYAYEDR